MKNIQISDGALGATFSIFQAAEANFALRFPEPGQDVQFGEDLPGLPRQRALRAALRRIWDRPIRKRDAMAIHGTIFYEIERYRAVYPGKREASVDPRAISAVQRAMYDTET
jgi:hypothetical protein